MTNYYLLINGTLVEVDPDFNIHGFNHIRVEHHANTWMHVQCFVETEYVCYFLFGMDEDYYQSRIIHYKNLYNDIFHDFFENLAWKDLC